MKKEGRGIGFLLVILGLFNASLGVLHGRKMTASPAQMQTEVVSTEEALRYVEPLIETKSIATAAKTVSQFTPSIIREVTNHIFSYSHTSSMSDEDKIVFLIGIIALTKNQELQRDLLNLLFSSNADKPLFYIALKYDFESAMSLLKAWAADNKPVQLNTSVYASFKTALKNNDVSMVNSLLNHNLRINSKQEASRLLDYVVTKRKKSAFVPILVEQFGANVNHSSDQKHTLLMKAVLNKDVSMVKALLNQGADADIVLDSAIGNAKQLAFEKQYVEIEQLLLNKKS